MPTADDLYAWATPAFMPGAIWDHTWVTNYDNRLVNYLSIAEVVAADDEYWFCWGSYHTRGGAPAHSDGFLGSMPGNVGLAR